MYITLSSYRHYAFQEIVSVEHVLDPQKGDRFLLELRLTDRQNRGSVLFSEYVYKPLEGDSLCYPAGFRWKKNAIVNVIVPVRKSGRWALYFIKNIAGIFRLRLYQHTFINIRRRMSGNEGGSVPERLGTMVYFMRSVAV